MSANKILPALCVAIVVATALTLYLMGRIPICACGTVELWYPSASGPGTSQHIADWYSFSHLIHGFIFYGLTWLLLRRQPIAARLLIALFIECGWEIVENTSFVIERYRENTVSLDYDGDSILNSVSDILFMVLGFLLARKMPVLLTVAIAVGLELWVGYVIRDNLTLNVLMLLWPIEAVREWQGAG